jgi:uncharacterized protein YjbJ (UPF0337 family)
MCVEEPANRRGIAGCDGGQENESQRGAAKDCGQKCAKLPGRNQTLIRHKFDTTKVVEESPEARLLVLIAVAGGADPGGSAFDVAGARAEGSRLGRRRAISRDMTLSPERNRPLPERHPLVSVCRNTMKVSTRNLARGAQNVVEGKAKEITGRATKKPGQELAGRVQKGAGKVQTAVGKRQRAEGR